MRRFLWALCAVLAGGSLCGCEKLFSLQTVTPIDALDAYAPITGCSPMSLVQDDFATTDHRWLPGLDGSPTGNRPTIVNGALHVDVAEVNGDGNGYAVINSVYYLDMRDDRITFELTDSGLGDANSIIVDLVPAEPNKRLRIVRTGTNLGVTRYAAQDSFPITTLTYDPVQHRFLRIANHAGVTTFETSATGGDDFTVQATMPDLDFIGMMKIEIGGNRSPTGGSLQFDLHSIHGGTSTVGACPIVQLADDFSPPSAPDARGLGPQWFRTESYSGSSLTVVNDEVEMNYNPDGSTYISANLRPTTIYDLRGGMVFLEVPQVSDTTKDQPVVLTLATLDGHRARIFQTQGQLRADRNNDLGVNAAPYDPVMHRWWRIRETAGTVHFEVSPDGITYNSFGSTADVTGLETTDVIVTAAGIASTPTVVKVDNFNSPPAQ